MRAQSFRSAPFISIEFLTLEKARAHSVNRWVNIILSIFFIATAYPLGAAEATADYFGAIMTITIAEIVALALIIWYAWKQQ